MQAWDFSLLIFVMFLYEDIAQFRNPALKGIKLVWNPMLFHVDEIHEEAACVF